MHDLYEMTIGIECHVQLATASKLFSASDNDARGKEPNAVVSPIDYGLPGMLPVLNLEAVTLAIKAGFALNADIALVSRFDRKHYFYPDLPKGYQTTQLYHPIVGQGHVDAPLEDGSVVRVRIHHAHMEEDAGKLTHYPTYSLVDLNRAGTPLIEIVSEPDIHSPAAAKAFATELYRLMTFAGVTHGDLYHGNMRFDVNLSVAKKGSSELGTRTETKNLNSFRSVEKAAQYEFKRQVELLERGERIVQETRGWDDAKQKTTSQRSKEDAQDYRYMPDPDIPPIILEQSAIDAVGAAMPLLPNEYRVALAPLQVDSSVVNSLLSNKKYADAVLQLRKAGNEHAKRAANWFASTIVADTEDSHQKPVINTTALLSLSTMVEGGELSSTSAKELFSEIVRNSSVDPRKLAESRQLLQLSDTGALDSIISQVLSDPASQKAIEDIRAGNEKAIGYLVGQVMQKSKGQANPGVAQRLIKEKL